ncbi:hypothetical protein MmiAt1_03710 [Methanimicrococcus sp. At1]|uniref:DUF4352 domain-containing protein n=1 Tax=Methanimicrococcus hacksteinii TaxID=3028293 RepID=A0ABU3VN38_9EURY|nr:hypothetical protein [Methanimicrococcus sp. At1]MDV0444828.1 hypothetical protein [Methanimicrococcus sp. At1]
MKWFKAGLILFFCAVLFSGCLGINDSENQQIDASGQKIGSFSGEIVGMSAAGDETIITVQNRSDSHYDFLTMDLVLNNETSSNINTTDTYKLDIGRFIYVKYSVPEKYDLSVPFIVTHAHVFSERGGGLIPHEGLIDKIESDPDVLGKGRILLNDTSEPHDALSYFSYAPSTYFSDDIEEGMQVIIYADPVMLTSYPGQGWAYEVWPYTAER